MSTRSKAYLGFMLLSISCLVTEVEAESSQKWQVYREWPFNAEEAKRRQEETAKALGIPVDKTMDLGNGVTLELVLIPAGRFIMGTPEPVEPDWAALEKKIVKAQAIFGVGVFVFVVMVVIALVGSIRQKRRPQMSLRAFIGMIFALSVCVLGVVDGHQGTKAKTAARTQYDATVSRFKEADPDEKPAHAVMLSKPFYMGKYEVTQEQYVQVMGTNPSEFKGRSLPVDTVSWHDAVSFCGKVGGGIRLPSDAEWEYSCRAGTTTRFYSADGDRALDDVGWYDSNSGNTTHVVGQKTANAWGLHDMHGNVWEWCQDWYGSYTADSVTDPQGPGPGIARVLRGGSGYYDPRNCRSAGRGSIGYPVSRGGDGGFRVVVPRTP